ncbi:MAG: cyclophilin-like fold protein [Dehalococcoidia bacterium]|tara:strand:+ start:321 stop:695 length:375 start_codon:yes stop_codon:yes gene_type:complete
MNLVIEFETLDLRLEATLNDSDTASALSGVLPIEASVNLWGDEIYFGVDLFMDNEKSQETVEIGDLAYWPPGNAFCIFFGETPASLDGQIKPASAVTVIGRIESDPSLLKRVTSGENITIRRMI